MANSVFARLIPGLFGLIVAVVLSACSASISHNPVPESLAATAQISGISKLRFWADEVPPDISELLRVVRRRIKAHPRPTNKWNSLALSGGGDDGAFGAGLLNGWSQTGTRPDFEVVTGVSTGAFIALFAYLGPEYDARLREVYTTVATKKILQANILGGLLGGTALAKNSGLRDMITRYVTADLLAAIGKRYRSGRLLLIGTTDLDSQRGVIWNIGRLAISNHPGALQLFRKIILASASIPGAFPPVQFNVNAGGKTYDELHVDGSVSAQVFLYPSGFSPSKLSSLFRTKRHLRVFVIRNSKVTPEYAATPANLLKISARSIKTLIKNQGIGDLYRIYALARRDGLDYNLAFIPATFKVKSNELIDQKYMRALFKLGEEMGRSGYRWHKNPYLIDVKTE